jgi:hypothetical protein
MDDFESPSVQRMARSAHVHKVLESAGRPQVSNSATAELHEACVQYVRHYDKAATDGRGDSAYDRWKAEEKRLSDQLRTKAILLGRELVAAADREAKEGTRVAPR